MAHRDLRKRRGGRTLKQGPEFRMQTLATRCCENAELMERGHYQVSYATPAIDKRPTAVSTSLQLRLSSPASTERSCFGTAGTKRNKFAGCTRQFATCATAQG